MKRVFVIIGRYFIKRTKKYLCNSTEIGIRTKSHDIFIYRNIRRSKPNRDVKRARVEPTWFLFFDILKDVTMYHCVRFAQMYANTNTNNVMFAFTYDVYGRRDRACFMDDMSPFAFSV